MKKDNQNQSRPPAGISRRKFLTATAGMSVAAATPSVLANTQTASTTQVGDDVLDVVIIGAGLAGLTAARDLVRSGNDNFIVLEARDRVGGRTVNHTLGGKYFSEAGGQWIGPGQTAIYDLMREVDLGVFPTYYEGNVVYLTENGRVEELSDGSFTMPPGFIPVVAKLDEMAKSVPSAEPWNAPNAKEWDAISLNEWANQQNMSEMDDYLFNLLGILTNGADPTQVSLLSFLSMLNFSKGYATLQAIEDGAQQDRIEGGSQNLSVVLADDLADKIQLSTPVMEIKDWDSEVVTVRTATQNYQAKKIIVALAPSLCSQINYSPALPKLRNELQLKWPAHGPGFKTAHLYDKPFWREKGFNAQIIEVGGVAQWAYDNSPADGSVGIINCFALQSKAAEDHHVLAEQLAEVYARALGDEALDYKDFHVKDWGREQWSHSCVTAFPRNFLTSGLMAALREPTGNLIWSGTETAKIWYGYMDGAVRSGHEAALTALNSLAKARAKGVQS